MIETIEYEPPTLDHLIELLLYYYGAGLYRIKSGEIMLDDALEEFHSGDAILGLINTVYNAVTHNWSVNITDKQRADIVKSLLWRSELQDKISGAFDDRLNHTLGNESMIGKLISMLRRFWRRYVR